MYLFAMLLFHYLDPFFAEWSLTKSFYEWEDYSVNRAMALSLGELIL